MWLLGLHRKVGNERAERTQEREQDLWNQVSVEMRLTRATTVIHILPLIAPKVVQGAFGPAYPGKASAGSLRRGNIGLGKKLSES